MWLKKCMTSLERHTRTMKSKELIAMFDKGFFGGLFDFNKDGKLDASEQAADFGMFMHMMDESEKQEKIEKISAAGLDLDELEFMDDDERTAAIEDAGLDPDDFDF